MSKIHETAFAKINLDLRVCHRRRDGYHDLDSIVVFAEAGDRLTFEPAGELTLTIDGPFKDALSNDDDNLVLRAARALADRAGHVPDIRITLEKTLPVAAGVGGGSADAAATLRGLTRLWDLPLGLADLATLAQTLGADVPVCLGSTAARIQGIGDRLSSIALPIGVPMMLVNPGKALSTPAVFRELNVFSGGRGPISFSQTDQSFHTHLKESVNDLEMPAIRIEPEISSILDVLRHQPGCNLVRMSGSGATCFGLFDDVMERDRAVEEISTAQPDWWVIGTNTR